MEFPHKHLILISFLIFYHSKVRATSLESPPPTGPSKHFVLIHGAGHGAWCWYKIIEPLRSCGHNVTAIDLAASGVNPKQVKYVQSISDYHQPLMDFMASLKPHEKVILVGHSMGGLALTQAMERYPDKVSVAVFVTAQMPGPQLNFTTMNQQDWVLATTLMRPSRTFSVEDQSKTIVATKERYGSVKRVFVVAEKDQGMSKKDFQLWLIERNPPSEVVEIIGADHMVMMSKPTELSTHLLNISIKYG